MSPTSAKKAPHFTLENSSGQKITLSGFAGKWVVLYFYPKDSTSGCTREAVDFTALLPEFTKRNAAVVGISPDSCASHVKFAKKYELTVELLSDPDHAVAEKYGVWQKKKLYGKEYMGIVRSTFLIDPKGNIGESWEKVAVAGHAEAVLAKIDELQR